jgi:hypothetical protein
MSIVSHDKENPAPSRAREDGWVPGKNGGWLKPIRKGEPAAKGYQKPHRYTETLQLARKASPAAMRTLIERMGDADSRVAVMAASLVLERAWGKPREAQPEEQHEASVDLSALTDAELALLLKLADSGRLRPAPDAQPDNEIKGVAYTGDQTQPG